MRMCARLYTSRQLVILRAKQIPLLNISLVAFLESLKEWWCLDHFDADRIIANRISGIQSVNESLDEPSSQLLIGQAAATSRPYLLSSLIPPDHLRLPSIFGGLIQTMPVAFIKASTCLISRSMMTTFRHSDCRLIMVQDLSLDSLRGPIDRRIRHTLNSYANARKEPRRQYIHARTHGASVYTLRPVFCILSSELIQSRGPPGDFRCGEIVIATQYFIELSHFTEGKGDRRSRQ